MLSEELIELANKTMHLKAETQTLEVKATHKGCPKDFMTHYQVFLIKTVEDPFVWA